MPTTLSKVVTATIVLALSAVVPGCSCSYSYGSGASKGTQAPTSSGKPINKSSKPAGPSKGKAVDPSDDSSKSIPKGTTGSDDDDAAPEPDPEPEPTSTTPRGSQTLSAKTGSDPEPEPEPVGRSASSTTFKAKTAAQPPAREGRK
ncbi:MAG: hypothetical protein R3A79_09435 [Nannocystaceae bacterium]